MTTEQYPQISSGDNTPPFGQPRGAIYDWEAEGVTEVRQHTPHLNTPEGESVTGEHEVLDPALAKEIIRQANLAFPSPQIPTGGFAGGVVHDTYRRNRTKHI